MVFLLVKGENKKWNVKCLNGRGAETVQIYDGGVIVEVMAEYSPLTEGAGGVGRDL